MPCRPFRSVGDIDEAFRTPGMAYDVGSRDRPDRPGTKRKNEHER